MIVDTALLSPDADDVQTYCGLDVCVTLEVMERLREMYGPRLAGTTYAFSRALQAPALDMSLRGIRLDAALRDDAVERLTGLQVHLEARLNELSRAICDRPLNPKSPKQIIELFTEDMRLPPVWKSDKGVRKLSADEDALEKYAQYLYARPIVAHITAIRSLAKQIERLTTGVSADGRMHTSFGIGSTDTGRFSSSKFVDGSGCVLPHAEALTRTGWKPLSEIKSGEEIAQYDAGNGAISFAPCAMNSFNFKGEMLHGESEQFKLTVTPGHRILHFGHRGKSELVEQAREVVERAQCYVPLAGRFTGGSLNYPPYLAALMADFSRENGGWRGALKRERKIARLLKLFDQYGVRFNEQSAPEGYRRFYLPKGHESSAWPKRWGPWVLELTRESAEALVEEARYWDAHDRGSGFIFYTKDEDQARWFATLAHLVDRGTTIRLMQQSAKSWSTTPIWCVNVKSRSRALLERKHWSRRAYGGKVFCPTVPSSFWLVRQDGFISITGNSNLQNLARDDLEDEHNISIRRIFIADEGQVLFSLDREQSESREIGYMIGLLFDDWGYLDAQEAGDTHTMVARLTWTDDLPWTGNDREDRALAEKPFHRKGSRRQLAKILAHGSNLFGKPFTLARETYTTEALVERFQSRYFGRFPGIPRFHRWVAQQLQQRRELTTIFGRRRGFFDRADDDATLRKAIAYLPQSATADRTNLGLYRVWANMRNDIQLLLQVHDSIVFQAPLTSDLEAIVQKAIELTEVALTSPSGRRYVVPGEMKWGFNLGNASEENPRGLRKWKAGKSASEARSLAA